MGAGAVAAVSPPDAAGRTLVRRPRTATVTATTPLRYLVGSRHDFRVLMTEAPSVAERIVAAVGRRIHQHIPADGPVAGTAAPSARRSPARKAPVRKAPGLR